ncbi:hypothetical protein GCM10022408_32410 [Hymenobacter fastidiosus]|uniref:Uncharacterized protein n=1 Tax=Hymenobacter fastidiosus TaxID=486264 RepID=A0ABP7SU26_9BACT
MLRDTGPGYARRAIDRARHWDSRGPALRIHGTHDRMLRRPAV